MKARAFWVGLGSLILVGAGIILTVLRPREPEFRGMLYEPALPAPEIVLTQGNGSTFRLREKRGQVVLLFFGYTSCPDVCPTTLSNLRRVMKELGTDAERVQVVFVTVDPERDTPQKIQDYVGLFDSAFIGLSGSADELEKVWQAYGVYRKVTQMPNSATGYLVTHSARLDVIDTAGNLRLAFMYDAPIEDILHDLKILLHE